MLKIRKPDVPIEVQGIINRTAMEMADMSVKDNISKGGYFILHDVVYQATIALPKGTEAKPGQNCTVKSLNDL